MKFKGFKIHFRTFGYHSELMTAKVQKMQNAILSTFMQKQYSNFRTSEVLFLKERFI